MSTLTDALDKIIKWFDIYKPELAATFEPGLDFNEIQAGEQKIGFKFPAEIYELYQWRNGSDITGYSLFAPCIGFLPFDEAIESSISLNTYISKLNYENEEWYATSPLFFFFEDNGCCCGILLQTPLNYPEKPVVEFGEGDLPRLYYESLTTMMLTFAECCETGAYYITSDGFIDEDQSKSAQILRKYNPSLHDEIANC